MLSYLAHRLASTFLVMTLVGVFVFLLLHLSAGDPAAIIAGDYATPQQIVAIRQRLGLDDPLLVQFGRWAFRVIQGDLGVSIFSNAPVTSSSFSAWNRRYRWRCRPCSSPSASRSASAWLPPGKSAVCSIAP